MKNKKKFILVAASMSAGKSSLINALIGNELLPSGNEATTSKVTRVTIATKVNAKAKAYSHSGSVIESIDNLCGEVIKVWNSSGEISDIDVIIPYSETKQNSMLAGYTLIDTPGANNSRDNSHKEQFINVIKAYPKSPILYVLNATQLGTNDDAQIIRTIREINPKQRIIFVLNKVDALDEEKGENAKHYVSLVSKYLTGLDYSNAKIIPLMAQSSLIAKKSLNQLELRRSERNILRSELERFRKHPFHFNNAAAIPHVLKKNVRKRLTKISKGKIPAMSKEELHAFIDYTGLSVVTALIIGAA